jgi:hypothetical protein
MGQVVKIKIPARDVPAGGTITKLTGEKHYTVLDCITCYRPDTNVSRVRQSTDRTRKYDMYPENEGDRFLADTARPGTFNEYPANRDVLWIVEIDELVRVFKTHHESA